MKPGPVSELEQAEMLIMGRIDLNGYIDEKGTEYIGHATLHEDGRWTCLAIVAGAFVRVELTVTVTED